VILFPLLTSWIVRTVAITIIIQDSGLINDGLALLGLGRIEMIRTDLGMTIGMTYMMLPYMVLPVWATMRSIDINLMHAARGLGASRGAAFRRVFLPLSAPGIVAGVVLVFTISLGFFVIPRLLGDQSRHVLSSWIFTRFDTLLLFGEGSAAALIMIAAVVLVLLIAARFVPLSKILNYEFDQK
jgi:putative spermidine/putrescine transport system permease protein